MPGLLDFLSKPLKPQIASFDPEGEDYDYEAAIDCGLQADSTGHWPSRCPGTGQILKCRKHEAWDLLLEGEQKAGYEVYVGEDKKYYSRKADEDL